MQITYLLKHVSDKLHQSCMEKTKQKRQKKNQQINNKTNNNKNKKQKTFISYQEVSLSITETSSKLSSGMMSS